MAFAALIAANEDADDGEGGLRALLPMAGRTIVEHQARRAIEAGASHIVIVAARVPAALSAAVERLRRDRIAVTVVRDAGEAADFFHPDEPVLLVADGLIAAPDCYSALADRVEPAILTVADEPENGRFERVDAANRWAGLAMTNASMVSATTAMLGDWDLQSTLMRRIVQDGADFVEIEGDSDSPIADLVVLAESEKAARAARRVLLARLSSSRASWLDRFVFGPAVATLLPTLLDYRIESRWLRYAAIGATLFGGIAWWAGWLWTGLVLMLLAGPIEAAAERIAAAQLRSRAGSAVLRVGLSALQGLAIVAFGRAEMAASGEIAWLVGAGATALLLLFAQTVAGLSRDVDPDPPPWSGLLADGHLVFWFALPFAIAGHWGYWLVAVAAYAALSQYFALRRLAAATRRKNRSRNED